MTGDTETEVKQGEEWIEVDVESEDGGPGATATILSGIAEVLRDAPEGYRYDLTVDLNERRPQEAGSDD